MSFPTRFPAAVAALLVLSLGWLGAQEPPPPPKEHLPPSETSCVFCHTELDPEGPVLHFPEDVHFQEELGCHGCHGGDPKAGFDGDPFAAHDEEKGFVGSPSRGEIPVFCSSCHSDPVFMKRFDPQARVDQLSEYKTSDHGKAVLERGETDAAVCTDCHGIHGIREASDPRSSVHPTRVADTCAGCHSDAELMDRHGVPISPYAEYKQSVHAKALYEKGDTSAPTCNDCHGNHGAVPPGVDTVTNICGTCHTRESTLFREWEQKSGQNLSQCIRCVVCHSNHAVTPPTDAMLGVGPESTCVACHVEGEKGYSGAKQMRASLEELKETLGTARDRLHAAERAGMEVSEDLYELRKAQDQLVEIRVLAHSFDTERFVTEADKGIAVAEEGISAAHRAFEELRFRRLGLAASLLVIALVIIALVLKIRAIESEPDGGRDG